MDTVVDIDASGTGILHREGLLGFGSGGFGDPTGDWESALGGHRDLRGKGREGTNAEGRRAKRVCSLPNGIRSGRVFDPATLSPTKQSRPPGPRYTTGTKHQGLSGHGPPLRDHDD